LVRQEQRTAGLSQKVTIRLLVTRPRAASLKLDKAVEAELLNDPKERAEHDADRPGAQRHGRIAKTGSVKVTEALQWERYSHVMHIVSNVEGTL
jgi:anthranilate synthase component 1